MKKILAWMGRVLFYIGVLVLLLLALKTDYKSALIGLGILILIVWGFWGISYLDEHQKGENKK